VLNKILILDDANDRIEAFKKNLPDGYEITITKTATDAIWFLASGKFYAIFLDHDVPDTHKQNGLEVAQFLALRHITSPGIPLPKIIIHSRNFYGSLAMHQLLPTSLTWPGVWDFPEVLKELLK
jgi:CheY-like chemotaxis protein